MYRLYSGDCTINHGENEDGNEKNHVDRKWQHEASKSRH